MNERTNENIEIMDHLPIFANKMQNDFRIYISICSTLFLIKFNLFISAEFGFESRMFDIFW